MNRIHCGDCRDVLKTFPEASVDACVTDPPYHLTSARPGGRSEATRGAVMQGFMGMKWDGGGVAFDPATWAEVLRVLKPGGYLLCFGGTRTYHRLACAIEDAGFEIRDQIGWAFGSGFPKSHNGPWGGTALKPAWEPICMARKPLIGTVAANVLAHGTGALNIDGCRVGVSDAAYARNHSGDRGHAGTRGVEAEGATNLHAGGGRASDLGRWPANLIHDGSEEVLAAFPTEAGTGSAARFFYCAKADRADRNEGLQGMPTKDLNWSSGTQAPGTFQSPNTNRAAANHHPTVKPTDLMRYLCRLVTPPGGTVLDPFMGSGSTLKAAELEGFSGIGIELHAEYIEIARRRIAGDMPMFSDELGAA